MGRDEIFRHFGVDPKNVDEMSRRSQSLWEEVQKSQQARDRVAGRPFRIGGGFYNQDLPLLGLPLRVTTSGDDSHRTLQGGNFNHQVNQYIADQKAEQHRQQAIRQNAHRSAAEQARRQEERNRELAERLGIRKRLEEIRKDIWKNAGAISSSSPGSYSLSLTYDVPVSVTENIPENDGPGSPVKEIRHHAFYYPRTIKHYLDVSAGYQLYDRSTQECIRVQVRSDIPFIEYEYCPNPQWEGWVRRKGVSSTADIAAPDLKTAYVKLEEALIKESAQRRVTSNIPSNRARDEARVAMEQLRSKGLVFSNEWEALDAARANRRRNEQRSWWQFW
jgi:hypothetical protein